MEARDVMTPSPVTLAEGADLRDALQIMLDHGVSGVPVVDRTGQLVGVLTEGDLLRRAEVGTDDRHWSGLWSFIRGPGLNAEAYVRAHSRRVADLMTRPALSVTEDTALSDVVTLMETKRVKRVPVVRDGRVVGLLSRSDLLRALRTALARVPAPGSDAELQARLRAELSVQPWFSERSIHVSVRDGIVRLEGMVTDERMRDALRVAAQNISGRKHVDDALLVMEPITGTVLP